MSNNNQYIKRTMRTSDEILTDILEVINKHSMITWVNKLIDEANEWKKSKDTRKEWVCNECNTANFTSSVPEREIELELHSCINCGGFEFHLEDKTL